MTSWLLDRPWIDGMDSWGEVTDSLSEGWDLLGDDRYDRWVSKHETRLCVVERLGSLGARHRRGLHRAGFRPRPSRAGQLWLWTPPPELLPALPDRAEGFGAFLAASVHVVRTRERLLADQALHVVRDVFGADVEDVAVLPPEPPREDEDDQSWQEFA